MKVNQGIPADHNLTLYEACLAYGPSFSAVLKRFNNVSANLDWFFMIFTLLADFQLDMVDVRSRLNSTTHCLLMEGCSVKRTFGIDNRPIKEITLKDSEFYYISAERIGCKSILLEKISCKI